MYRENHGKLFMTELIDCKIAEPEHPTILQCLYFMSYKAARANLVIETDVYGNSIRLRVNNGQAPRPPGPHQPTGFGSATRSGYDYHASWDYADPTTADPSIYYEPRNRINAVVEPWLEKNHLGPKTFHVTLEFGLESPEEGNEDNERLAGIDSKEIIEHIGHKKGERSIESGVYVGKFWDGYKDSSRGRDEEVAVYQKLRPLWGKTVPNFIAFGEVDFFWALFIERIEVTPQGTQKLTLRERISPKRGTPRNSPTRSVRPSGRSMNLESSTRMSEIRMSWLNRMGLLLSSTLK
jgi:hypothetical protein